tara:strand:- start:883 stop:1137 length:255 start_codon:yes stop_codon:yes gene_type:complete
VKLTLVIDTEDPEGVKDAYKVASMFYKKHGHVNYGKTAAFSKIAYIKMLRAFAKEALHAKDNGEDPSGLRFTKNYADKIFNEIP